MSLETGAYIITNRITNGVVAGTYDLSPLSKVVTFPGGVEEPGVRKITKINDGYYTITQEGGVAVEKKGTLFLSREDEDERPDTWKVEHVPQHGKNAYIITKPELDGFQGWVVPNRKPYTQLSVRPLIMGPSYPPHFPPTELFDLVRDDRDNANDAN